MGKQLRSALTGEVSEIATIADVKALIQEAVSIKEAPKKTSKKDTKKEEEEK